MSLHRIAQLAGVSTSTVSRVVHDHPSVASDTATSVRAIMQRLSFTPAVRARREPRWGGRSEDALAKSLAFIVLGTSGANAAPAFEKLLRGVSAVCAANTLNLTIHFLNDVASASEAFLDRRIDGVLLHGEQPVGIVQDRLRALPAVWLMANRCRPRWGDQVMPNNAVIGDLAAKYLIRRGHRRLAHLSVDGRAWSLRLRGFAFLHAAEDAGAETRMLEAPEAPATDYWCTDGLAAAANRMVDELLVGGSLATTGLFVAEDRVLPWVDRALRARGVHVGTGGDVEIVSCNNEQAHHAGIQSLPAVIDIRPEAIGRRGVEQLIWRMRNRDVSERMRTMVEPVLIEPITSPVLMPGT